MQRPGGGGAGGALPQTPEQKYRLIYLSAQAPRFVPSVPERVFAVLAEVTTRNLPPTRVFCEWGSGFGTATCMASLLGYEAYGLESEEELVRLSRAIARRLGMPVEILCTS